MAMWQDSTLPYGRRRGRHLEPVGDGSLVVASHPFYVVCAYDLDTASGGFSERSILQLASWDRWFWTDFTCYDN